MLRVPNPGSDIKTFAGVFRELFDALKARRSFSLDDMSRVLVDRRLMTSSGFAGAEALERGYREDRSLDGPFNQSKMYSELLRVLGWIHPTEASKGSFKFTLLGAYVANARLDRVTLLDECLFGIAYPNPFVAAKGDASLRPFASIMRAMGELDGLLTRDEMIVGPLSLHDDREATEWEAMIELIRKTRGSADRLAAEIGRVSNERAISLVTMRNYTRFPLGAVFEVNWADRTIIDSIYGRGVPFMKLTPHGERALARLKNLADVRATDLTDDVRVRSAFIRLGFYGLLERAGFETTPVAQDLTAAREVLISQGMNPEILFSPFQELTLKQLAPIFEDISGEESETDGAATKKERGKDEAITTLVPLVARDARAAQDRLDSAKEAVEIQIRALLDSELGADIVVEVLYDLSKDANKEKFYPLVASLFRVLGYDCNTSRHGVNYERYDALIRDPIDSIPIEIKSPGEEEFLSVKGVRQALENKVILLARKQSASRRETTSLVVCYNLPSDRAEVSALIRDFLTAYQLRIGVCDFRTLLRLAVAKVADGLTPKRDVLATLTGILDVSDAA